MIRKIFDVDPSVRGIRIGPPIAHRRHTKHEGIS